MVTQIAEGVRRYTAKQGKPINLALPPLNYGGHPYHHLGMPGTVVMPEEVVRETLIYVMLGLWNDGFRKQIVINNHGQLWMLEAALQEFMKRYHLPGVFQVLDWHRAVREFFYPIDGKASLETHFVHADESETSVGLLLFPRGMVDMSVVQDAEGKGYCPTGILISPWIRSVVPIAGPRARGIPPSREQPRPRALWGNRAWPPLTRRRDRLPRS